MCLHINYRYTCCSNPETRWMTWSPNYRSICIEPCRLAYNAHGELDHSRFTICPAATFKIININSTCTDAYCRNCSASQRTPDDPAFEDVIMQGIPGQLRHRLPRVDEIVWYVPAVHMRMPSLNDFTWDQPPKKRKRHGDLEDSDDSDDEGYNLPLSPKSRAPRLADEYECIAPIDTTRNPLQGFLSKMAHSIHLPGSQTKNTSPGIMWPTRHKLPASKTGHKPLVGCRKPTTVGAATSASLTTVEDPLAKTWDWSAKPPVNHSAYIKATSHPASGGSAPGVKRMKIKEREHRRTL